MKKLLYIGHAYHNKTQSTAFLKDMFRDAFEVDVFDFDPYVDDMKTHFDTLAGKCYDVVVIFQIMPQLDKLKKYIKFKHCAFFPMYDGVPPRDDAIWYQYRDVNIINFSKTLHAELKERGFSSYYFQFFPQPIKIMNHGEEKSVFFWQRINNISIDTLGKLIDLKKIKHIHMHSAIDPGGHKFVEPPADIKNKVSISTWFDTREQMQEKMQESAIYIAPRIYEGIGMSFLEAMAMGRCVIAPNNPTMNEYITDGENGILYDLNNPMPVDLSKVRQIQQRTEKCIQAGYEQWNAKKYQIIKILQKAVSADYKLLKKFYLGKKKYQINICFKLFDFIPLVHIVGRPGRVVYKLFAVLPLIKVKGGERKKRVYFCGIPVLKIKR